MLTGESVPPLSIVIPCHHQIDLLRLCLQSVMLHAPGHSEVIVVDDGSPGGAVSSAASAFPGVRVIRIKRRRGFCFAANRGLESARAPVVELLNDDTQVTAGWAEAALAWFADPAVAAVAPLVLRGPDAGLPRVDSAGDECDRGGFYRKRGHGKPLSAEHLRTGPVFGASASSGFYRRSALEAVGLFPEEFGAYFEDVDLSFRLNRTGYSVQFEPKSRVWHRGGSSYGRKDRRLLEQKSCNEERVFWRNMPGPDLLRSLPRHMAVLAGKAVKRCREGSLIPFLMGRVRVLGEVGLLVRHRRRLRGMANKQEIAKMPEAANPAAH
jgi:GT2 family glycosyltransferase